MDKIDRPIVHEPWGSDRLLLYLEDAFRILNEAHRVIADKRRNNPYSRSAAKKNWHLENILTEDLLEIAVNTTPRFDYQWDTESKDPVKKNRIDITIIYSLKLGFERRLGIECKRLKDDSHLCREYYENGIQRFVTGYYSEQMPLAGMVGFIQEGDISQIIDRINRFLDNQMTIQGLKIFTMLKNSGHTYLSIHYRYRNLGEIHLYHMMLGYGEMIR
jgi:hypothetical protein